MSSVKTKTVGEILREARETHRVPLDTLAKKTRIRVEYLRALENNEFEELPAATFVKGYIKTYGRLFGFDHQPVLAVLRRDYKQSAAGTLVPREFLAPVVKNRRSIAPVTVAAVLVASVFFVLMGYVGSQWYALQRPPELVVYEPEAEQSVAARVQVRGRTAADALLTINEQPVALQPDGSFSTQLMLPTEGLTTITLVTTDRRGKTNREQRTVYVRF